ncbi:hypothetical protein [Stieleria sp.]|uniref:hypothetical protein n=1 Tax=Stieleria sp. TaxID=2795976 RepID=UPI003564AE7B
MTSIEPIRTGILVHGCNLHAENWRRLAWGEAPNQMGRIPQALLAAVTMDAAVIVFGTGASRKRYNFPGSPKTGQMLLEAEYTLAFLESHFDQLLQFKPWSDYCAVSSQSQWDALKQSLRSRIELDIESEDTIGELRAAGERFVGHRCNRVVLVSSPTHLVRVLRDASNVYPNDRRYELFHDHLLAMPSGSSYEGFSVADVVVVEPPHRPDRQTIPTHRRIARLLGLQKLDPDTLVEFVSEFDELLQQYEDRLQRPNTPTPIVWPVSSESSQTR